jgi:beta-galactosidase
MYLVFFIFHFSFSLKSYILMVNRSFFNIFVFCLLAFAPCLSPHAFAGNPREEISLNRGWLFHLGTASSAITVSQAEAEGWRTINVPHDFQIEQPWVAPAADEKADNSDAGANIRSRLSARGFKEMGEGWYVRSFIPKAEDKGRRALLDFEGIMYMGDVYLNGNKV